MRTVKKEEDLSLSEYLWVAILTNWLPDTELDTGEHNSFISVYNGNVMGAKLVLFPFREGNVISPENIHNLALFIARTNSDKHINDIENIFIVPESVIKLQNLEEHTIRATTNYNTTFYTTTQSAGIERYDWSVNKTYNFNDYTPKNNKCFCFPYNYLLVSNNAGNINVLKYEDFNSATVDFEVQLAIAIGMSRKIST